MHVPIFKAFLSDEVEEITLLGPRYLSVFNYLLKIYIKVWKFDSESKEFTMNDIENIFTEEGITEDE